MTVDIPVFNEDGSIKFTQTCNADEAKHLLQFALNFLVATGMSAHIMSGGTVEDDEDDAAEFDEGAIQWPTETND